MVGVELQTRRIPRPNMESQSLAKTAGAEVVGLSQKWKSTIIGKKKSGQMVDAEEISTVINKLGSPRQNVNLRKSGR